VADAAATASGVIRQLREVNRPNVHLSQTLRLVDALIDAGKDFELLVVPGVEHGSAGRLGYVIRRTWDFLVRYLLHTEPPSVFKLADPPLNLMAPNYLTC
jgi:hypothetical protein